MPRWRSGELILTSGVFELRGTATKLTTQGNQTVEMTPAGVRCAGVPMSTGPFRASRDGPGRSVYSARYSSSYSESCQPGPRETAAPTELLPLCHSSSSRVLLPRNGWLHNILSHTSEVQMKRRLGLVRCSIPAVVSPYGHRRW